MNGCAGDSRRLRGAAGADHEIDKSCALASWHCRMREHAPLCACLARSCSSLSRLAALARLRGRGAAEWLERAALPARGRLAAGGVRALRHAARAARSRGARRRRRSSSSSRASRRFERRAAARSAALIIAAAPGKARSTSTCRLRGAFEPARRDRDLILVDQRGTGRSAERLRLRRARRPRARYRAAPRSSRAFVDACVAELEHDPRFYTTSVAVRDLERAARGARHRARGTSTACRTARASRSTTCAGSRSARARSCSTASCRRALALGPDVAREAQRALEQIFARCAADAQCGARFAACRSCSREVLARLESRPWRAAADEADAAAAIERRCELRALVRFMSYNAATVALLPVLISEAHAGNYAPLVGQARTLLRGLPESLSFPMSNSVICTEDVPFIAADVDRAASSDTYLGTAIIDALRADLRALARGRDRRRLQDARRQRPARAAPVRRHDPITPPAYAERVNAGGAREQRAPRRPRSGPRPRRPSAACRGCCARSSRRRRRATLDASCLEREPPTPFFLSAARARAVIEVDSGSSKQFGAVRALDGVSFSAADGRITGLLGPNGAGKSTCLRILSTVLKPDRGAARVGGIDLAAEPLAARRALGVLPHSSGLYPQLTARENIEYYGRLHGLGRSARSRARVDALLERLDLGAIADRKAKGFSQGERTKVALARALVHDPQHLLARRADERPRRDGDAAPARLAARAARARALRAACRAT